MRTFEILLIVANLLALLALRVPSKSVWLWVVGMNVLVFLLHGLVEGFRYQMIFSYGFVVLLTGYGFAKACGMFANTSSPRALKLLATGVSGVLIVMSAILAYVFPVFVLPRPTGEYAVGVEYLPLVDENRTDPFRSGSLQKRALMVKVYYPATSDDMKPFALYFHGSTQLLQAFAAFYQMPHFLFDHLRLVSTHSKDNLALSEAQPRFPVVLLSHGAGASMEVETSPSEDLASHGYVVVAIDHSYVSAATEFPDHIVTAHEATTDFNTPEPAEPITQIMADDDSFIIGQLHRWNEGSIASRFRGKLNLDAIGVLGHSVGGAVAYNLAINDRRVKAAINVDGAVYVAPERSRTIAPFLMLANDRSHVQAVAHRESLLQKMDSSPEAQQQMPGMYGSKTAYEAALNKAHRNAVGLADVLAASGNLYTIEGSDHMKFTDIGLFIGSPWLRERLQISGKTDPARCLKIMQALTAAFFDQHLKGQTPGAVPSQMSQYPELKKVRVH